MLSDMEVILLGIAQFNVDDLRDPLKGNKINN